MNMWKRLRSRSVSASESSMRPGGSALPQQLLSSTLEGARPLGVGRNESQRRRKKEQKKGDQDACHFRLNLGSFGLPKLTQSSTRYRQLEKIYENSSLVYSKSSPVTSADRN